MKRRADVERIRSCIRNQFPLTTSDAVTLLGAYDELWKQLDQIETWACEHVEGDGLRVLLYPAKEGA